MCRRVAAAVLLAPAVVFAAVRVPSVFSDHMVLQKGTRTPVWGMAAPGEAVQVRLAGRTASATANASGAWRLTLDLADSEAGPFVLEIAGGSGGTLRLNDVAVGEVWMAAGQSNMALRLKHATGGLADASGASQPSLRWFSYTRDQPARSPQDDTPGRWKRCEPADAAEFSAVAYYFGRGLQREVQGPVGIVQISMGGTAAESWLSPEAIAADAEIQARQQAMSADYDRYAGRLRQFEQDFRSWAERTRRADAIPSDVARFTASDVADSEWRRITLPGTFGSQGLADAGVVWRRRPDARPGGTGTRAEAGRAPRFRHRVLER